MIEQYEKEVLEVKKLCDRIGYGNAMNIASSLWRKMLKDQGYPTLGAFIPRIVTKPTKDDLSHDTLVHSIVEKIS